MGARFGSGVFITAGKRSIMRKHEVKNPQDALLYLCDCQLATCQKMAMKKSRASGEYNRQKLIAQSFCDCG